MADKINLEEELEKEGFRKVGETSAGENITLQIPTSAIPGPEKSDVRVFPEDFSFGLKIVDKADLEEGYAPGKTYVIYEKRPSMVRFSCESVEEDSGHYEREGHYETEVII